MTVGQISLSIRSLGECFLPTELLHTHTNTFAQTNIKHLGQHELWLWLWLIKLIFYIFFLLFKVLQAHSTHINVFVYNANFFYFFLISKADSIRMNGFLLFHHNNFYASLLFIWQRKLQFYHFFIKSLNLWDLEDRVTLEWTKIKTKSPHADKRNEIMRHRLHDECAIAIISVPMHIAHKHS